MKHRNFAPKPIFKVGLYVHKLGAWIMGYKWGTDLYVEGMKYGISVGREQAFDEACGIEVKESK